MRCCHDSEKKKANGTLSPFDPSGAGVDPNSRVKLVLKLNKDQKSAFTSRDSAVYISSSSDDEEASDDASSQSSEAPPRRRSNRATTKSSSKRVNRLQRLNQRSTSLSTLTAIDSEADDRPVRRSTRNRKSSRLNPDAEYEGDSPEVVSVSSSSDQEYPAKKKKKKVVRSEASIPAYGKIRPIADLQLDLDFDDIFHSHRHDCEKCHQPPAHELLNKLSANRRKKAKKDEDDEDPEERYASLGGWVRW